MVHRPFLRRWIHRCGMLIGVLFLVFVADAFVSGHMTDSRTIRALPGTRHAVNGTLEVSVASVADLGYQADSTDLSLTLIELRGRIWRGDLRVAGSAQQGSYRLQVVDRRRPSAPAATALNVRVFETTAALNASYPSLCRKVLGISAWWGVAATLPALVGLLLFSYLHSARREFLLEQQGIFSIVKLARQKECWEAGIAFHGEQPFFAGDRLRLLDTRLAPVGEVRIHAIKGGLAIAVLDLSVDIAPGYYVQIPPQAHISGVNA